jgi:anthranilate phosphoribosyltransferase
MKHIAPVRRALKVSTFFNILGPMINPSTPKFQVLGVNNLENFNHYKNIYETLDVNYAIVNSQDGYDEISLTANAQVAKNHKDFVLAPADFEMEIIQPEKLFGGDSIKDAAKIFLSVLDGGGTKEQNNAVIANAALGLQVYYHEKTLMECVDIARESLESKSALTMLKVII